MSSNLFEAIRGKFLEILDSNFSFKQKKFFNLFPFLQMDPKRGVNWSIPRASLSSNSSTSSKSYNSSDSIRNYHRGSEVYELEESAKIREQIKKTHRRYSDGPHSGHFSHSSLSSAGSYYSDRDRYGNSRKNYRRSSSSNDIHLPKRGSRSSQGSTDSNHVIKT